MRKTVVFLASIALLMLLASAVALAATIACPNGEGDLCVGTSEADTLNGRDLATDDMRGRGGADTLLALGGADTLTGGLGDDTLNGSLGSDTYRFDDGWGQDTIDTEDGGADTLDFSAVDEDGISIKLVSSSEHHEARATSYMGTSTLDYPSTVVIENVRGGSLADSIHGNAAKNELFGNAGYDSLYGALGKDVLNSGGADGSGDNLYGGDGADMLYGGSSGSDGVEQLHGDLGNDTIDGGDGVDWMIGGRGPCSPQLPSRVTDTDSLDGGSGDDLVVGSDLDDTLVGGPGKDRLYGDQQPPGGWWCIDEAGSAVDPPPTIAGDDHIYAVDGEQDEIYCGGTTDTDTVEADPIDVIVKVEGEADTCETVNYSTP